MDNIFQDYLVEMFDRIFDKIPVPVILVDKVGVIRMINKAFADFLLTTKENAIGRPATDVDRNSKWPIVLKTGELEIAKRHRFAVNGKEAIVHRIPIYDDKDIVGGFGMVLFDNMDQFKDLVEKNKLLETELSHYKKAVKQIHGAKYSWDNIVACSKPMTECKNAAKRMARSKFNVLITGESGVGKELMAQAIHNESDRKDYPFVKVNCAAIPENLLESELFGYEEGAFTGALRGGKMGKFELADHGTIFLDEIGDMPLNMQSKILRVLQEGELERVGGNKTIKVDVRVIAATNRNLEQMIVKGEFREDLYFRLNVLSLDIPPLRERRDDIALLVEQFLYELQQDMGIYKKVDSKVMDILLKYPWPGNIRELKNIIERMAVNSEGDVIVMSDVPMNILKSTNYSMERFVGKGLNEIVSEVEKDAIRDALRTCGGNKSQAADKLKVPRSTLYRKMEEYGIDFA